MVKAMDINCKAYVLIGFLIAGFLQRMQSADALQCYVCENCVEGTELQVMQICGELTSTRPATTLVVDSNSTDSQNGNTQTTALTTKTTEKDDDFDEDDDDSDEDRRKDRHDIRTVTFVESTTAPAVTSMFVFPIDEDTYEDNAERKIENFLSKKNVPVCYMVKYQANGTQFTNLGCTSMLTENEFLTCQSLNRNDSILADCRLCSMNGCNKLYFNSSGNDYNWDFSTNDTGSERVFKLFDVIFAMLFIFAFVQ